MKKALLLILVLMLTLAFAAPALALDPTITADGGTGNTNVTYTVAATFTVTIPESVTLVKDSNATGNVTLAADHILPIGKTLNFAITAGTNAAEGKWYVKGDGDNTIEYTIKDNTTDLALNAKVPLKVTEATTADFTQVEKPLTFAFADSTAVKFADTYSDQLTFTVTLDDNL